MSAFLSLWGFAYLCAYLHIYHSFTHQTFKKYLCRPGPYAKHQKYKHEINVLPALETLPSHWKPQTLKLGINQSAKGASAGQRGTPTHPRLRGAIKKKAMAGQSFAEWVGDQQARQGKEECCRKGIACITAHQFMVSSLHWGARLHPQYPKVQGLV
jgi:hypothetical protein